MEKRSMQAVVIRSFGAPSVLEVGEVPVPEPRSGHVRIRVTAAGVNYYDTLVRRGAVSQKIPLPHVMGSDVVGEVDRLGPGVTGLHEGQKVIVAPGYPCDPAEWGVEPENEAPSYFPTGTFAWGGYAPFMEVPALWLLPDDTGLPPQELASIPLVLVTAVHAVKTLAGVGPRSRILVQAGASGSGSMAIQVAKALGAAVLTTVSTPAKAKLARRLGADEVIFYRNDDVASSRRGVDRRRGARRGHRPRRRRDARREPREPAPARRRRELRLRGRCRGAHSPPVSVLPQRAPARRLLDGEHGGAPLRSRSGQGGEDPARRGRGAAAARRARRARAGRAVGGQREAGPGSRRTALTYLIAVK